MIETLVTAVVWCNNLNWEYSPRCTAPVAEFHQTLNGFEGTLESGVPFKQTRISSQLMLFEMEGVRWITNGKAIVYLD